MSVSTPDAKRAANALAWASEMLKDKDDELSRNVRAYAGRGADIIRDLLDERDSLLVKLAQSHNQKGLK